MIARAKVGGTSERPGGWETQERYSAVGIYQRGRDKPLADDFHFAYVSDEALVETRATRAQCSLASGTPFFHASLAGGNAGDDDSHAEIRLRPEAAPEGDSLAPRASDTKGEEQQRGGSRSGPTSV